MRGIVQYEVYVFDAGRWSLHSRYPGAQRLDAMKDAVTTEEITGHPAKVVRDTYYPEDNRNEEITAYLSPKAKRMQALNSTRGRKALTRAGGPAHGAGLVRTAAMHPSRRRPRDQKPTRLLSTIRLIVAIGWALIVATAITAAMSLGIGKLPEQWALQDGTIGIVLTTTYLLVFLFVFPRTFRKRLRIHQILAEMWESADKPKSILPHPPRRGGNGATNAQGQPWTPAHDRRARATEIQQPIPVAPSALTLEIEAAKAAADENFNLSVTKGNAPPAPPQLSDVAKAEAAKAEAAKAEKEKVKAADAEKAAKAAAEAQAQADPLASSAQMVFTPGVVPEVPEGLALERIILRRFAVDVVMPSIARSYRDDPVTRRGVALLLAGAVEQLSKSTSMTSIGALALLAEALRESGARAASIEAFLGGYQNTLMAPNAKPLLNAGREAIAAYVDGGKGIERTIQQALAIWRFPSTARLVQGKPEFFLFSIAREESLADGEPSVGLLLHHAIVRAAAQEFVGEEVPHDGAGVLLRFEDGPAAFTASRAIQSRILAAAGPATATVIVGGTDVPPGPDGTASILEHVRSLLNVTVDGEIVCDAAVHSALADPGFAAEPVGDGKDAVRLVEPATAA